MSSLKARRTPGAGQPIPVQEDTPSRVSVLKPRGRQLTQRTLFQYGTAAVRSSKGKSKRQQDYTCSLSESLPWGDHLVSGREAQEKGYFRILSHNVNGLSKHNCQADVVAFARAIKDKAVGLFGIQETNRNFERVHMLDSFHKVIKGISTHHQGAVSSAKLSWQADFQPGGTAVSVRNKWASRYLAKGSDDFGRWSWITLTGQGTTKITFISGYRVCNGAPESDITSKTVRSQQEWMYADKGLPQVNLRKQFVDDIIVLIRRFQKSGNDIVLMMDANEGSGSGTAADTIALACGLRDAHSLTMSVTTAPATHNRGSEKIDFVLISPRTVLAVRSASILSLQDGYLSDHRALVVDFDAAALFASETSPIVVQSSRQLTSTNPAAVKAYLKHILRHIDYHRIEERVQWLAERSSEGNWGQTEQIEWEKVDCSLAQGRRAAEAKCPKKRLGKYPWSPEFDAAGRRLHYWKLRMREFTGTSLNTAELNKLAVSIKLKEDDTQHLTAAVIYAKIQHARKQLRQVKAQSAELRDAHLIESARFAASLHNTTAESAVSAIRAREKSSRQFRQLRSILRTSTSAGLERIDVPNAHAVLRPGEQIPRIPLVTKEEIEEVLVPHTERRFTQHQETPFGNGYRQRCLGVDCTSCDATALRTGTYDYKLLQLTEEARQWLVELKTKEFAHSPSGLISCEVTAQDVIDGWAKMRESTSSAPGGHYGHYKTASVVARLPEDHPDYTRRLAEIYATLWTLPLKHGFAPQRWSHCIDAILEKIPGKPIIEKLRIIMLYEADFNFVLKLMWGKRLVRNAEKHGCLGKSNHGSRKGRQATDAQLEKLLLYDITRLTRTSLVTVDNDAKSCYDRILKPLSMTACIAVGLPLCAATMHNLTHHRMVHRIKSRHGLLRPYSGTDENTHEGTGQGSGASPAIWLIYMVTLLNAFAKFSPGMHVTSPYQALSVVILAVFFVDDGMPGVNDALDHIARPLAELIACAEQITQSWERLLFVSGGALELTKCFAYVIYWDLSSGTHRMLRPDEIPGCSSDGDTHIGPLSLTYGDISKTRFPLDTVAPWIGRRTLGVRIAPAGTWTDELKYRRDQARELSLLIAGSALSPDTASLGYHMMVCPKIEYPLTVTQFTQRECDSISASVIRACISTMGYNCNMPREVVYGPISLFGLGIHDLYIEQGIKQVSALVGHLRQDSDTGRMMQIELQWCQVQSGIYSSLLANIDVSIDYIETCWIMGIRDFLRTYDLKIDLTDESAPHDIQRVGDEFIMDALLSRGDCTALELQRINACRLYLQVARISDITSIDGKTIRDGLLRGANDGIFTSVTKWPRQGRPPKLWWRIWKHKLQRVFSLDGHSSRLRIPLGGWTDRMNADEWRTTTITINGNIEVYERIITGGYKRFVATTDEANRGHRKIDAFKYDHVDTLPAGAVPAALGQNGKTHSCRVYTAPTIAESESHSAASEITVISFEYFLQSQPDHIRQLMRDVDVGEATTNKVAEMLSMCLSIHAGTDGGLMADSGTFGFVWSDGNSIFASGKGHTTGGGDSTSSTRAELSGILAALTYVRLVAEYAQLGMRNDVECIVHCDSKAALQRVKSFEYEGFGTSWRCRANYDLEVAIKACMARLPFSVQWKWVRGHASRRKKLENFTWPEVLNSHADEMATAARSTAHTPCHKHWPEQTVSVIGPQGRITGHLSKALRHCCTSRDLLSYWKERYHWTAAQAATVDITATKAIAHTLSAASTRRIQKLRCGWLPVNSREARHDPDQPPGCVACTPTGLIPETVDHIFQCCSISRRRAVNAAFSHFYPNLRELKTSTCIIRALQTGATAWIEDTAPPTVESLNLPDTAIGRLTARAYEEQTQLGWNVLFRGFWSHSWRLAQEEQFRQISTRERQDTGVRWSARIQMWFIELFETLWTLRNDDQHGKDIDTERLIRVSKCERAIRRLYDKGAKLPYWECHPFRAPIEQLLSKSVTDQELWILQTERYLPKALRRIRNRGRTRQQAMTKFYHRRT